MNKNNKVKKETRGRFPNYDEQHSYHTTYSCPSCNCTIHLDWNEQRNYCPECGVKLDWSEVEAEQEPSDIVPTEIDKSINFYEIRQHIYRDEGIAGYELICFVESKEVAEAICKLSKQYFYVEHNQAISYYINKHIE